MQFKVVNHMKVAVLTQENQDAGVAPDYHPWVEEFVAAHGRRIEVVVGDGACWYRATAEGLGWGVTDEAVERVRTTLADALLNDQRVIALVQDWLVDEETAEMLAYQIIGGMQGDELHTMLIAVITGDGIVQWKATSNT